MLLIGVWRPRTGLYMSLLVAFLYSFPTHSQMGCKSESCITCVSASADCTVDNTTSTIWCSGDTSHCNVTRCGGANFCFAYYGANANLTSFSFTSYCIAYSTGFDCSTVPATCTSSGIVGSEEKLFGSTGITCYCNSDNCTSNITYSYTVNPSLLLRSSFQSPSATTESASRSHEEISVAIPILVALFLVFVIMAAVFATCLCVKHHRSKTRSSSSSSRVPQTSAFSHMVPTDPLLPHFSLNSPTCSSSLPSTSSSPPSSSAKLIKMIGRGRFSAVWKAELSNEIVAAKVFTYHNRHSWENERHLYSMESTSHPSILQFLGSEMKGVGHDTQMCIFTPFCELGSLNHFLKTSPPVTWAQMCRIVRGVVGGVAHLHSEYYTNGDGRVVQKYAIAHRDVKSANVLMRSAEGDCVVGDLGLALVLDPTVDPKQMANSGQVGTFRYMAPEALDARVNLQDLESFKQIDIYALALVMWEVAWRCEATAHSDGVVPPCQLPFQELAGDRPTLERMKDIVVTDKQRPPIPPSWRTHEGMCVLTTAIQDSWDDDSEARLTAAGIMCRLDVIKDHKSSPAVNIATPVAPTPTTPTTIATSDGHIICTQVHIDHAMPPPYSAEDPHPQDAAAVAHSGPASHSRFHFQSSLPLLRRARENGRMRPLNAQTRNVCNSAILECDNAARQQHQPAAVRYSLVLSADRLSLRPPRASGDVLTTSVSMELAVLQANHATDGGNPTLVRTNSLSTPSTGASAHLQRPATLTLGRTVGGTLQVPALSPNMEVSERSGENTTPGSELQSACA
uniref:receptor protein serine/threonine kinase n=1 Tax=Ephydatia fluviatilis TaxID=31330 RepID=Q9UAG1_9METZ|nr:sALK-5 [Ephydatia fluviatilis]